MVSTIAGSPWERGTNDGVGVEARFWWPTGLAVDKVGNLYVSENNNTIRMVRPEVSGGQTNWLVSTIAGSADLGGSADGAGSTARFRYPQGLLPDESGNLFVADVNNHTIRLLLPEVVGGQTNWGVQTIAGTATDTGNEDGPGSETGQGLCNRRRSAYSHGLVGAA